MTENEILAYFKDFVEKDLLNLAKKVNPTIDTKFAYFNDGLIDFAFYSVAEKKFLYIEFPWRENNEVIFKKIHL